MTKVVAVHAPEAEHLAAVRAEMERLGAPTIRALWHEDWEVWIAIEGSHRLAAAAELGLMPELVDVSEEEAICHDMEDVTSPATAAELLEYLGDAYRLDRAPMYDAEVRR